MGILIFASLLCLFCTGRTVLAAATPLQQDNPLRQDQEWQETMEGYLDELDFSEIDKLLGQQEQIAGLDFRKLVELLVEGEEIDKGWLMEGIFSAVFSEIQSFRGNMIQMVLLCMVFAILYNFANVFERPAVTEISFYMEIGRAHV